MKKALAIVLVLVMILSLGACGSSNKLEGNWICEESHSGYPDQMTLFEDGTGSVDGFDCNWTAADGIINFSLGLFGTKTYNYEISGSVLYLDGYAYTK